MKNFKMEEMIKCPKCGHYTSKEIKLKYGTCLCGEIIDKKAKFNYEMFVRLHLWRDKRR